MLIEIYPQLDTTLAVWGNRCISTESYYFCLQRNFYAKLTRVPGDAYNLQYFHILDDGYHYKQRDRPRDHKPYVEDYSVPLATHQ